eukprot:TRINITY_DN1231_c0_g1_i1.p1 TRINITY_DN1231_c0_g1~~TRINITY_DN1231_c0_g1_i1.p1  ORF type:complete len:292 (-),score=93.70 TRINITY_DN1231_c0_g1_i1:236-1111(-)
MEDTQTKSSTPITSVFVSNISESANAKTISDFFSFCGRITDLKLSTNPGPKQAIVTFGSDSAAKTALLLTNAMIIDRPITVTLYQPLDATEPTSQNTQNSTQTPSQPLETQDQNNITNINHQVPDHQRTQTSTVASLIAAGYTLGTDALVKAREYDEQHGLSTTIINSAQGLITKASEIDQQYHVSAHVGTAAATIWSGAKQLDQQMHITETATSWASWAGQALVQQPVINSLYTQAGQYLSEAQQLIEAEQSQRSPPGGQEGPAGSSNQNSSPTTGSVNVDEITVQETNQ